MKQLALVITLSVAGFLAACIEVGQMIPLDETAKSIGTPKIEIALHQTAHGGVGVAMPDGEILQGEYQVLDSASGGLTPSGQYALTGLPAGSRNVFVRATGPQTEMSCNGLTNGQGHGSAICEMSSGAHYRILF
ncbi:hypothetical protein [Bradyrhizobium sp. Tv2a-2]|uniref:hypothetical protein n=1 Tax=Bradyrhizobium sp. Tv2a-2 TaxID=113395 RepID=UPI000462F77C|nr:hypothetical protein [Bradyrhizobium sp. Tv2a-2]